MSIAKRVVARPTTFIVLYGLVLILALYISPNIPVDLFTDITPPILLVVTNYDGAGPEEVEKSVTKVLEGVLSNVSNLQELNSTSSEAQSTIRLNLKWGEDLVEATNEIRDNLEFVRQQLPDGTTSPQIFKFNPSLFPIFQLALEGNRSVDELFAIAEDQVQDRLEQVDGVAFV
jgi:HAE1 family hydrophobic/amphiphilic exporter-1